MWDISKIQEHISNGIEESINLDYKGPDALGKTDGKKAEISKDVSSFANSGGGVIIFGVDEFNEQDKKHLPEKITPINRKEFSKEWLEQVINSNIYPKINGIKITPITIGKSTNNQVIYVVEIPQSHTAHQAKDKRYYKRYNFESVAMEDYEVKDIINRSNKTDIQLALELDFGIGFYEKLIDRDGVKIATSLWAYNKGNNVTRYLEVFISGLADASNYIITPFTKSKKPFQHLFSNEVERKVTISDSEFIIGVDRFPILPNTQRNLGEFTFYSELVRENIELEIIVSTDDGSRVERVKVNDLIRGVKTNS